MDIQTADMAINPPMLSNSARFKSNNKTLISWALGVPVANNAEEMDLFLEARNRQIEIDKRWKEIKEKWDIQISISEYKKLIDSINKTI